MVHSKVEVDLRSGWYVAALFGRHCAFLFVTTHNYCRSDRRLTCKHCYPWASADLFSIVNELNGLYRIKTRTKSPRSCEGWVQTYIHVAKLGEVDATLTAFVVILPTTMASLKQSDTNPLFDWGSRGGRGGALCLVKFSRHVLSLNEQGHPLCQRVKVCFWGFATSVWN